MPMFGLADVNSFYASCEALFRPDLRGKPVVVLSNNDGCVIARSAGAKKLGIKMGAPWFQIKNAGLCGACARLQLKLCAYSKLRGMQH